MNVVLVGNCQMRTAELVLKLITHFSISRYSPQELLQNKSYCLEMLQCADLVFFQDVNNVKKSIHRELSEKAKLIEVPRIISLIQMQDCIYLGKGEAKLKSPIAKYHSFLTLVSYLSDFNEEECVSLFDPQTFSELEYYEMAEQSSVQLKKALEKVGLKAALVDTWLESKRFMYTLNHPAYFVIEDIYKGLLRLHDIPFTDIDCIGQFTDPMAHFGVFPVLIANNSINGLNSNSHFFQIGSGEHRKQMTLQEFVVESYKLYRKYDREDMCTTRMKNKDLDFYAKALRRAKDKIEKLNSTNTPDQKKSDPTSGNPYRSKPDTCFWSKAITRKNKHDVDPVYEGSIKITDKLKVATAGSCFAQHISKRLKHSGFNYYVEEKSPNIFNDKARKELGFGVFSCRYGNIYTTRQLIQLFDQAFGRFSPEIEPWVRKDNKYIDPLRPNVFPSGFDSQEEQKKERRYHLRSVREMFEKLDVFVFTLGLTECWRHNSSKAILPVAPGVVNCNSDLEDYSFKNFTKEEVQSDLVRFINELYRVNPAAQVILSVSPVPLAATYENRNVLTSTTASKSILRVVSDEVSNIFDHVHYFPSYEIITGNFNRGKYYAADLREVTPEGVDHVMRLFMEHYTDAGEEKVEESSVMNREHNYTSLEREMAEVNDIICDEESLDE